MKATLTKLFFLLLTVAACLLPVSAAATVSEAEAPPPAETVTDELSPSVEEPEPPQEDTYTERLEDIQVLLMYLCGIAIFWAVVECAKLLYRFFNMFF